MPDAGNMSLMDARQFIYLPKWVKYAVLIAATLLLILAAAVVLLAVERHAYSDSIVFFVSVGQSATLILIFFLIVSFSRRDANVNQLHVLTDEFLRIYIATALAKVSIPTLQLSGFKVQDEGPKDIFGRLLKMTSGPYSFQLWVGLNVRRIFVIYFVPLTESLAVSDLKRIYEFTFGGAAKIGYECNFEEAEIHGARVASIWLTVYADEDLLTSPQDKLFWAQDIAMMTESFLRTAVRHKIDLVLKSISPGPL